MGESMKKRIVSVLMSVSVMTSLLTGCSSSQADDQVMGSVDQSVLEDSSNVESTSTEKEYQLDSIKLVVDGTFGASVDAGQDAFIEQWEKAVGIDLEINQLDHSSYTDGVGRLFASGDYPDVILLNASMYNEYARTGLLWDMTSAYDNADFQERMVLPQVNVNLRIDGKQYGLATGLGGGCITYVKKSWLDAVGMSAEDITDWDSYYAMLTAFAKEDPDGNGKDDTYGVAAAGFLGSESPYINYLPQFWLDSYPSFIS